MTEDKLDNKLIVDECKQFISLAAKCKSVDQFIDKARDIQCSKATSLWFRETYGNNINKAVESLIIESKRGK